MGARALILSPTRELAMQTAKFLKNMGKFTDLRHALLVGGDSMEDQVCGCVCVCVCVCPHTFPFSFPLLNAPPPFPQFSALAYNPDIIIATPGRLMHMLSEVKDFKLGFIEMLVFDEADRLFEMGFVDQLREIVQQVPEERQTLLFSATMPKLLVEFSRAGLKSPQLVRLDVDTKVSSELRMVFFTVRPSDKYAALLWVMHELLPQDQQAMVFVSTRHHVELVCSLLRLSGSEALPVYGMLDQTARNHNLARFRSRKVRFLVVTDVAARGIDIPLLDNVVNFDFPDKPKLFVHRCVWCPAAYCFFVCREKKVPFTC